MVQPSQPRHETRPTPRKTRVLDAKIFGNEIRESVVSFLSPEPVAVDELVRRCQLTAPIVRTILF
ncbi:MAG: hypothetical protein CMM26_10315 [Rhodospirillaceae bacterium]|nr:hypothetical protein [Rhodospirillaceae bacterium]